jgi:nucleoside-diphosphate-sugar epimerase
VPLRTARYNRGVGAAEEALERFRAAGGEGVTLRFAYFYGRDSDFTRDVIATVRKGWAPTPGTPDAYVSSVSHDDAAAAVIAALQLPAGTYNVCDDEPVTHRDYFASLARLLEIREPRFAPEWTKWLLGSLGATLARSQRMSNKKLRATGLWTPALPSIREGWSDVLRDVPAPPVT